MTDTLIDFIRHGEPVGGRIYRGNSIDDPLSEKGWSQMWAATGNDCPWNEMVTSPLTRCAAFAAALSDRYDLPLRIDERFKEVGFGSWEGRTREQIQAENRQEYEAFYRDPVSNRPAGAEPLDSFFDRVSEAFNLVIKEYTGRHVLIVTHAGVVRAAMAHALQTPLELAYRIQVSNAGITRFCHNDSGISLEFHNRLSL